MQYERIFQIVEFLPDGEQRTDESPGWRAPERPTFVRGSTAIVAAKPACSKFGTTFSGLRMRGLAEDEVYPEGAVWLVETPIDSAIGVAEEPIEPLAPTNGVTKSRR